MGLKKLEAAQNTRFRLDRRFVSAPMSTLRITSEDFLAGNGQQENCSGRCRMSSSTDNCRFCIRARAHTAVVMGLCFGLLSWQQLEYLVAKERLPQEFERLVKEYGAVREVVAALFAETTADWEEVQSTCLYDVASQRRNPAIHHTTLKGLRGTYPLPRYAAHSKPQTTVAHRCTF